MSTDILGHDHNDVQDHFEESVEQKVFMFAKKASIGLAIVALMFSALDVLEIRSRTDVTNFWQQRIRPQIGALLDSADSEMQRVAYLTLDDPGSDARPLRVSNSKPMPIALPEPMNAPAVAVRIPIVAPSAAPAPMPLPEPAPAPVAAVAPPPLAMPAPAPAPVVAAPAPVVMAEPAPVATPPAPARGPVLASLPSAAASSIPEPSAVPLAPTSVPDIIPLPSTASLPILSSIPLPRPAPDRAALDEPKEPTPAELLGLDKDPKARAKAEKCLANAVYFESRSEPLRGQMAVAQVVMNRTFSPFYPKDVCSVVYQNAHRRLACQFTFACDGKSKAITERGAWGRANRIAKQTLDGKLWVPEVAKSTHYHAAYVHPYWVREMRRMFKTGIHLFYRPYNWGDGSNEAGWGIPTKTAAKSAKVN